MTPLAPLTMQELKLSQTLDGANMSPYHTTGEFATSLVLLRSRRVMYTCSAEHTVLSLSRRCACPTNMSTSQVCTTTSSVHGVNFTAGSSAVSPATLEDPAITHDSHLHFMSDEPKTCTPSVLQSFQRKKIIIFVFLLFCYFITRCFFTLKARSVEATPKTM